MSMFSVLAELVVLILAVPSARGETVPAVMIDFERVRPGGVLVPDALLKYAPLLQTDPKLGWVMITREDVVRIGVDGQDQGPVVFEVPHVDVYRAAVGSHGDLYIGPEGLRGLRDRQREIALPPVQPRLLSDQRVRDEMPADVDDAKVRARFIERLREGGARLHLAGPDFTRVVDFADLDEFNRASGLQVSPNDFWRETLFFWFGGTHEMSGGYVMKTADEAQGDCARILIGAPTLVPGTDQGPESHG